MANPENIVIYWWISCFDKRKEDPLPVYTRGFVLDESRATDEQKVSILKLIRGSEADKPQHPVDVGQTMVTVSHGIQRSNRDILKYRNLFMECSSQELRKIHDARKSEFGEVSLVPVILTGEYFEDENGKEITKIEMMDYVAGGGPTIIAHNPQSVTRLGPSAAKEKDKWTVESANTIAHLFQIVNHIVASQWYCSPLSMTILNGKKIVSAAFPSVEGALGILVLFRQLYSSDSKDDLFNRACGIYVRHADHKGKAAWVRDEKKAFKALLSGPPQPPRANLSCTMKELLDLFLYGAGIFHSRGKNSNDAQRLKKMLHACPREELVMAFHSSTKYLVQCALVVYPVIKQDFIYWIKDLKLASPNLIDIEKLLSSELP